MNYRIISLLSMTILIAACVSQSKESTSVKSDTIAKDSIEKSITDTFGIDYITGNFDPEQNGDFITIPVEYADREGLYLRNDAFQDFVKMYNDALLNGINLQIRSATRNFESQKGIWERKWDGNTILSDGINAAKDIKDDTERALKILEYSSMPGTSRHHWGTDIDLNSFNNDWFSNGEGLELYNWMVANAHKYGYCQPYTEKGSSRPNGYNEEKWHWSYMPVSVPLTREAKDKLKNEMITGFKGSNQAITIDVVRNYILGVNTKCK